MKACLTPEFKRASGEPPFPGINGLWIQLSGKCHRKKFWSIEVNIHVCSKHIIDQKETLNSFSRDLFQNQAA